MPDTSTFRATVRLPAPALAQIDAWADKMQLPPAQFYTRALIFGARAMVSSLSFLPSLPPELRQRAAQAGNDSVTPQMLAQIVLGNRTRDQDGASLAAETDLAVDLPADLEVELIQAIESSGIAALLFYSLAFVTGARALASTLGPESVFTPQVSALAMEKEVTPEALVRTMRKKGSRKRRREGGNEKR